MIEIVPPVDPAEELKNQWRNEVMPKIKKARRGEGFNEELEKAKRKINQIREAQAIEHFNAINNLSRYRAFTRRLQDN